MDSISIDLREKLREHLFASFYDDSLDDDSRLSVVIALANDLDEEVFGIFDDVYFLDMPEQVRLYMVRVFSRSASALSFFRKVICVDDSSIVRIQALRHVIDMHGGDEVLLAALRMDEDWVVRREAVRQLANIFSVCIEEVFRHIFRESNPYVRWEIYWCYGSRFSIDFLMRVFAFEEDYRCRLILARLFSLHTDYIEVFAELLMRDEHPQVRIVFVEIALREEAAGLFLERMLLDVSLEVRRAVVNGLSRSRWGIEILDRAIEMDGVDSETRKEIVLALRDCFFCRPVDGF